MITIKQVNFNDLNNLITYDKLDTILTKRLDSYEKYFVVIDENKVLGHAVLVLFPDILAAQITEIYVLTEERGQGLGDGLLRTVFNYLRINSFNFAIIKYYKELENFLTSMDMKKVGIHNIEHEIKDVLKNDGEHHYYTCKIDEFFERKCKGSIK